MTLRRGFTLIEVMISLAVLSLVVVALMGTQTGALRLAGQHRDATLAADLLRAKLAETLAIPVDQLALDSGMGEGPYDHLEWERTLHPTGNPRLTRVRIEVRTPGGRTFAVETLMTPTQAPL